MTDLIKGIIVDLDGTLFNTDHRVHHVENKPKDFAAFEAGITDDTLNMWCYNLVTTYNRAGYAIILLTGRYKRAIPDTRLMLSKYRVPYDQLFHRMDDDKRPDSDVKKEVYEKKIAPFYGIEFVLEDRKRVVKMWRDMGITALHCAWGDF